MLGLKKSAKTNHSHKKVLKLSFLQKTLLLCLWFMYGSALDFIFLVTHNSMMPMVEQLTAVVLAEYSASGKTDL